MLFRSICSVTGSIVASGIFSGVFSGVVAKTIQCIFDKKLANHKAEVQKVIDEHQIRFKYWNEEKIKATKELYSNACDLACSMGRLHFAESNSSKNGVNNNKKNKLHQMEIKP